MGLHSVEKKKNDSEKMERFHEESKFLIENVNILVCFCRDCNCCLFLISSGCPASNFRLWLLKPVAMEILNIAYA